MTPNEPDQQDANDNRRSRHTAKVLIFLVTLLVALGLLEVDARSSIPRFWQGVACWPASHIENILEKQANEQPVGRGNSTKGRVEIWASRDGASFSIVASVGDDDAYRCIIAHGSDLLLHEGQVKQLLLNGRSRGI